MTLLTGHAAITYATTHDEEGHLGKYADPIEEMREPITIEDARAIAHVDPSLIYWRDLRRSDDAQPPHAKEEP